MVRKLNFPKHLLAIDSTTISAHKTQLPWALFHGEKGAVKLHIALDIATQLPQKITETIARSHDSTVMEDVIDRQYIVIADRGYEKIERFDDFNRIGQKFVIRIKESTTLVMKHSLQKLNQTDSNVLADYTCKLGNGQNRSRDRFRIVEFTDYHGKQITVVSNLLNTSAETIAQIYKARWSVEVFFRWVKQNLKVSHVYATTPNGIYNQLYGALICYVLLKFIYEYINKKAKMTSLTLREFKQFLSWGVLPLEWNWFAQELRKLLDKLSLSG